MANDHSVRPKAKTAFDENEVFDEWLPGPQDGAGHGTAPEGCGPPNSRHPGSHLFLPLYPVLASGSRLSPLPPVG